MEFFLDNYKKPINILEKESNVLELLKKKIQENN